MGWRQVKAWRKSKNGRVAAFALESREGSLFCPSSAGLLAGEDPTPSALCRTALPLVRVPALSSRRMTGAALCSLPSPFACDPGKEEIRLADIDVVFGLWPLAVRYRESGLA